jgi:5-methyltetrahydropteroyltriglutamate--homocysteine methyltransferase
MLDQPNSRDQSKTRMQFRADTVGSLLRPDNLLRARADFAAGKIGTGSLRDIEDRAIRVVVAMQEELGFRIVTDGEFRRENWWIDFVSRIGGVEIGAGTAATAFDQSYVPKHVRTVAKLKVHAPIVEPDYRFLAQAAKQHAKVTIPSPTRMHFHGGRNAVAREAYPDIEEFFADLAAIYRDEIASLEQAGCRYVQIDDPLLTYFLSPKLRAEVAAEGDVPDRRLARYVALINQCISAKRPDTVIGIHLCRGNARSEWMTEGAYDAIAEQCFGGLNVDRFLLEFDDPRSGSFEPLRFMPAGKQVVLGLVTTKTARLEDKDEVKRRIANATQFVAFDHLAISPQCGFASVVEGNKITPADQRAKLALVVDVAREVWGEA